MTPPIEYKTACQEWEALDSDLKVTIKYKNNIFGHIPLQFLQRGGARSASATYLCHVFRLLYHVPPSTRVMVHYQDSDSPIEIVRQGGVYTFSTIEDGTFLPRKGPQGKSLSRAFRDTDGNSTVSNSARSSCNQDRLLKKLLMRDGACVATGEDDDENVIAAHIVPLSLGQDYLDRLTSSPGQVGLYSVSNGLLLRPDMHHTFDRFHWSIFVDEANIYYLHVFCGSQVHLHGKQIEFRVRGRSRLPNPDLLRWHYSQCLMARIRARYVP